MKINQLKTILEYGERPSHLDVERGVKKRIRGGSGVRGTVNHTTRGRDYCMNQVAIDRMKKKNFEEGKRMGGGND